VKIGDSGGSVNAKDDGGELAATTNSENIGKTGKLHTDDNQRGHEMLNGVALPGLSVK
jgi:hypothetical protein